MPDQARGFFDLGAWDPADRFDHFGRVAPAKPRIELESGTANHLSLQRGDAILPFQREARAVSTVAAGRGVVRDRLGGRSIPREKAVRIAMRRKIALAQQSAGIGAHEERHVAPITDEVAVEPSPLDHQIGDAESERTIGAGPHPQPQSGLAHEAYMTQIDNNQAMPRFSASTTAVAWVIRVKLGL
jgi:hypothetical protein